MLGPMKHQPLKLILSSSALCLTKRAADTFKFLMADPWREWRNTPLSGHLQPFLDVSRQHPAEVRNPIEVTQYLGIKISLSGAERNDISLCTAACCACEIESGRNDCLARDHPVFGIKRLVFLKIENDSRDLLHHLCRGQMKSVFDVAFPIGWRHCQFAHNNNQILLYRKDLIRNEFIRRNGAGESQCSG